MTRHEGVLGIKDRDNDPELPRSAAFKAFLAQQFKYEEKDVEQHLTLEARRTHGDMRVGKFHLEART